ncbi:MAG: hypothetical protein ACYCT7_05900 [bacterium]
MFLSGVLFYLSLRLIAYSLMNRNGVVSTSELFCVCRGSRNDFVKI